MKVLLVNTTDSCGGGAAHAVFRLHAGLRQSGIDSQMLVQHRQLNDPTILQADVYFQRQSLVEKTFWDQLWLRFYQPSDRGHWSINWLPNRVYRQINNLEPDILHLNWIGSGMIPIEKLRRFKRPIVWSLLDMWPFTGGCHYDQGCGHFQQQCGHCPLLKSHNIFDLSHWIWRKKNKHWGDVPFTLVAISHWLADQSRRSRLFRDVPIQVIPVGLDTNIFKPIEQRLARSRWNIPQDKKVVFFGSLMPRWDRRKGFDLFLNAVEILKEKKQRNLHILIVGEAPQEPPLLAFPATWVPWIENVPQLCELYSAADVLVAPSRQEAFGQIASEAMSCGTPVVAFENTGLADIVDHKINGYLAQYADSEDLARGISWVLEANQPDRRLSREARKKVEEKFDIKIVCQNYLRLYNEILFQRNILNNHDVSSETPEAFV